MPLQVRRCLEANGGVNGVTYLPSARFSDDVYDVLLAYERLIDGVYCFFLCPLCFPLSEKDLITSPLNCPVASSRRSR